MQPTEVPYTREPGYAHRYRDQRFATGSGRATDARERQALRDLLRRVPAQGLWLDMPSGAGRFTQELPGTVIQVDRDPAMLAACGPGSHRICSSGVALPFRAGCFAGAVCMRLMQHLPTPEARRAVLSELRRVTTGPLVVSFFDRSSLAALRRAVKRRLGSARSGREAIGRRTFAADLAATGWRATRWYWLRRCFSEQCLVLAEPDGSTFQLQP